MSRAGLALLRFFVRSVIVLNADVLEDAMGVVATGTLSVARGVTTAAKVSTGWMDRVVKRGADEVVVRVRADEPLIFERLRLFLVVGMVVILGLIVLFSVFLG
jgi:uncharacterized BrkB/YihY/UPF0761 family membrane protein